MTNLFKAYIGIGFLAVPFGFTQAGLYGAILSLTLAYLANMYSVHLLIKARNRYKDKQIRNLSELAETALGLGQAGGVMAEILLVLTQTSFTIGYVIYFGEQMDQIACKILEIVECGHQF